MNGNIKKIKYSFPLYFTSVFLLLFTACSTIMEPEGDAAALPMIDKLEMYKKNNGHYPKSLIKLIPEYIPRYDFQAFIYTHHFARGKDLADYLQKGLIPEGKGEGYSLVVRFQHYTGECTYINGKRKYCRYIGK